MPDDALLTPELMAQLDRLSLQARRIFLGRMKGERRSKKRGISIEFADYRDYVQGDDLRFIDWNIYGRLDRLLLKLFHEEEDLHVYLLLDHSFSMGYGKPSKLRYGKILAAAMAYIVLSNMERVGITGFCGNADTFYRPVRGRRQIWRLLSFLQGIEPDGETNLEQTVRTFNARNRRSGIVLLISDFLDPAGYENALRGLLGRGMDVFAIQVMAPEEVDPTITGDLRLLDVETADMAEVTVSEPLLAQYRRTVQAFRKQLRGFLTQRGANFASTTTDVPPDEFLLGALREGGLVR
jgi:uncharacterized protein (DUF58 family)